MGMDEKMPRTPTVFSRKTRWRQLDDSEFSDQVENYRSTSGLDTVMLEQFRAEEQLGMMFPTTVQAAKAEFKDRLKVSAQGTREKSDGSFRI